MSPGPNERLDRHRTSLLVLLPPVIAALALAAPTLGWQITLLAPLVALLGVPHGALDHRLAALLWPLEDWRQQLAFMAAYLGLAGAVVALWIAWPAAALALFLLYSGLHFSDDWRGELSRGARSVAGLAVVAGPAVMHEAEVAAIFAQLAPEDPAARIAEALAWIGLALLPLLLAVLGLSARARPRLSCELALLAAAFLILPPIAYFIVYFCAVHSPRHFLEASAAIGLDPVRGAVAALPITLVTLAGAGGGALALFLYGSAPDAVTLKAVFIGLAALTVPHMLIVDRLWRAARPSVSPATGDRGVR